MNDYRARHQPGAAHRQSRVRFILSVLGATACTAACLFGALPANAITVSDPRTEHVRTDDLNLLRASGRERLDTRLRSAVRAVCDQNASDLSARTAEAACLRSVRYAPMRSGPS